MVEKFGWQFRVRDKVIQTENDHNKDVFKGDIGQIAKIDPVEPEVTVQFDQREVVYDFGELDEVALAYHHPQVAGVRVPGRGHAAGDAAVHAVAAQSGLHRYHVEQEDDSARRPVDGPGDGA